MPLASKEQTVEVALTPPHHAATSQGFSKLGAVSDWFRDGALCGRLYHTKVARKAGPEREHVFIAIAPTDRRQTAVAPAGDWKIDVQNLTDQPVTATLRIRRDDELPGTRSGARQSKFEHPDYSENDRVGDTSPIRRAGTLNPYATGTKTFVVGGYDRRSGAPAKYSSEGPADSDGRRGPDCSAATVDSGNRFVLAVMNFSDGRKLIGGTSAAAPQAARRLADKIAMHGRDGRAKLLSEIEAFERAPKGPNGADYVTLETARHGDGRLKP